MLTCCPIYQDIKGKWKQLGSGSFGNVYKGQPPVYLLHAFDRPTELALRETSPHNEPTATYLGIDVAIKEVLPSNKYDVSKYFDREWRLMRFVNRIRCRF